MKYKELNQRIDDMKGEIIEGIRQSVSIYSVKSNPEPDAPFGKGPKDALENAIEQAEKLGLKAKNIDMDCYNDIEEMVFDKLSKSSELNQLKIKQILKEV